MLTTVAQAAINGLLAGALLALPAIGFTLIFAVLRFANFAVAGLATVGAFAGYWANASLGLSLVPALMIAFLMAGMVGLIADRIALHKLRPAGALTAAIASIALNLVLENIIRFGFGNDLRGYDLPMMRDMVFGGLRVSPQQLENLGLATAVMAALFVGLTTTSIGRAMRAAADNPDLARLKGIDLDRIAVFAAFLSAGLAGLGGMLIGLDTSIDPLTGFRLLLSIFAAAVVGGLGSIPGAVVGAIAISLAEEVSLLFAPATYRTAVGFFAILVMLSFRPRGLLGDRAA